MRLPDIIYQGLVGTITLHNDLVDEDNAEKYLVPSSPAKVGSGPVGKMANKS
jgi:hypothetical protein